MLFYLLSTADGESFCYVFLFFSFLKDFELMHVPCWLTACLLCVMFFSCVPPLPYPVLSVTPSGRLNGRYAETTPLSPHPSAQCADREPHKTKDKGRQRQTNREQWEGETQSDGSNTNSHTAADN